jgi:hypothetical protein
MKAAQVLDQLDDERTQAQPVDAAGLVKQVVQEAERLDPLAHGFQLGTNFLRLHLPLLQLGAARNAGAKLQLEE